MAGFSCLLVPVLVSMLFVGDPSQQVKTEDNLKELQNQVQTLMKELAEVRTEMAMFKAAEQKYAATAETLFLATINSDTIAVSDDQVIVFNSAPINPGGHYNTESGGYTVPFSGYYQFSVTKRSDLHQSDFWLLVDSVRYAYNEIHTGGDGVPGSLTPTSSFTINIQLTAGQVVQVENDNSASVTGTNSGYINSWFTGHMLYAL